MNENENLNAIHQIGENVKKKQKPIFAPNDFLMKSNRNVGHVCVSLSSLHLQTTLAKQLITKNTFQHISTLILPLTSFNIDTQNNNNNKNPYAYNETKTGNQISTITRLYLMVTVLRL